MQRLRPLIRNVNVINAVLVLCLAFMAAYLVLPGFRKGISYQLPAVKQTAAEEPPAEEAAEADKGHSLSEYIVIAEQNVFHPERKIPPEKKAEAEVPKPDFFLYGTLITDSMKIAYLDDKKAPQSTTGRGNRQSALQPGDTLSGYTLKEVETDWVKMVRGTDEMVVLLTEPGKPKTRETVETTATAKEEKKAESAKQAKTASAAQRQPGAAGGYSQARTGQGIERARATDRTQRGSDFSRPRGAGSTSSGGSAVSSGGLLGTPRR